MRFPSSCNIDAVNIEELASMLENSEEVAPKIEDIHTKLLRKIRKTVPSGKWENVLAKFAYTYSMQDAWELERFGYKKSSLSVKLRVLKALVESQFDRNVKFKSYINGIAAQDLRAEPVGRDMLGNIYWCIMDKFSNIRIFRENPDDESWTVMASNRDEMVRLIEKLSSNDPEIFSADSPIEEDSCSTDTSINSDDKSDKTKIPNKDPLVPSSLCKYTVKSCVIYKKDQNGAQPKNVEKNESSEYLKPDRTNCYNESGTTKDAPILATGCTKCDDKSDAPLIESGILKSNNASDAPIIETSCKKSIIESDTTKDASMIQSSCSKSNNELDSTKCDLIIESDCSTKSNNISDSTKDATMVEHKCHSINSNNEYDRTENVSILESSSSKSNNEFDTTKDVSMVVTEKPAGLESEAQLLFSSVISEPVLIIQGQGNGEDNNMGNVKNGDNSNKTPTSSDNKSTKVGLPLKKKINKSYCENVSGSATIIKQKDDESIDENNEKEPLKICAIKTSSENSTNLDSKKEDVLKDECTSIAEPKAKKFTLESDSENDCKSPELNKTESPTENENNEKTSEFHEKSSNTEDSQPAVRGKRGRKTRSGIVDGLDLSQVIVDNSIDGGPPVRQSRRIAQQKIKEETDRRMIEEKLLREMKKEAIRKKKKTTSLSDDEEYIVSDSENSKNTSESRTKKKKSDKPWLSSTSESSSESEPEEDFIEHDRRSPYKSDHEFSPESDLETECAEPTKRARTVKAEGHESDNESVDSNVDHACQKCGKTDHPEWILLCDSCDKGYHCSCLTPVLFIIPEGDWFCPKCQHAKLIENLQNTLLQYDEVCFQFELLKKLEKQENSEENSVENIDNEEGEDSDQNGNGPNHSHDEDSCKKDKALYKEGSSSSSSSETDEDDIPIYKLRRRNQNSNYRFNDYDDLINSAINRGIADDNEPIPSGKDIRNIIKSNSKQETARSSSPSKSRSRSNSPTVKKCKTKRRKNLKKKKLNNLDDTSDEDDASDTDFKDAGTSTDTENSLTEESESSLELSLSRKSRKARKKKDIDFINDGDESDKSTYNMRKQRKKIQKILEDSDDFDEDEMTESEEIDSADLCSDTETDSSHGKKRGKTKLTNNAKSAAEKSTINNRKRKVKKPDDDKAYRSGIKKKTKLAESASSSSDDDKALNSLGKRRTRGKKLHYILDEDFESSDDGITPGVQRPDTPPEERERFIKKQEEIKRMLAEKNTAAAKELATPKIKSLTESGEACKQAPLSVVPIQVIEGAKVLDMDFLKSSKAIDSDEFDDELAVNFSDPGDVNEDELAKIMEEEDFAQHQLKLDDEASARKSVAEAVSHKKKVRDFETIDPSDITKIDKRAAMSVSLEKSVLQDCAPSRIPAIGIDHNDKPFMQNYLPGKSNELHPYFLPNYPCAPPPIPVVSTSILQQMKQQAIPLQGCQQPTLPTPSPAISESHYLHTSVPLALTVPLVSNKVAESAPPNLLKDVCDIRRRRRKKITPLRGDLYKAMDDHSIPKPVSHLHYHLPPNAPAPEIDATDYINNKRPGRMSDPCSSTHAAESLKPTEVDLRYPQGAYAPSSNFPQRAQPAANINTGSLSSSSGLHESSSRQSFTFEPVNAEDQPVESPTAPSENNGNVTVDAECSSEFSGLVSYFSSQQNELNA